MSTTKPDSLEFIRAALAKGEKIGLSDKSPTEIVSDAKKALKMNSQLQEAIVSGVKSGDAGEFYMNEIKRQLDWK
jgi:hypothetical protein